LIALELFDLFVSVVIKGRISEAPLTLPAQTDHT
jgi:hypothetical protein